jgi:ssDNA-binding Zn-finger/Zn-ribbon topoisomerase 1
MKILIHAKGVYCNHIHVNESYDLRQVTCKACKHVLRTNEAAMKKFTENKNIDSFVEKKRVRDLDKKIVAKASKGLICEKCLKPMVKRLNTKKHNHFFGCSGYPNCKHTLPYNNENMKTYYKKDNI